MAKRNMALLVIDMQKGSFTDKTPRFDANNVIKRINSLSRIFRNSGYVVFFIQHNGHKQNTFLSNTKDWELLSELEVEVEDVLVEKQANDIFYGSKLGELLLERKIDELFITGCATDFCIEATVQSALAKDYMVTVVADAHTTTDRPHIKAEKVIEHYNWVWQNMIPTKGCIKVSSFSDIEKDLSAILKKTIV